MNKKQFKIKDVKDSIIKLHKDIIYPTPYVEIRVNGRILHVRR